MRIVAGSLKGRAIVVPPGHDIRPTSDRAREALFNRLAHGGFGAGGSSILADALVLDAFCGTGALGFEALSRGARAVTFIDSSQKSLNVARENAEQFGVAKQCNFVRMAFPAVPVASQKHGLVFLDPPYASDLTAPSFGALAAGGWLAPDALCSIERPSKEPVLNPPEGFSMMDDRRYGAARIQLFRYVG
jgi:16S rRNA (guanine966-N2)-methyltransferase